MQIIQIVGYKNSGKTTLAESLINFLSKKGVRVASLKHHGHGGIPLGIETTDSDKHEQAGALIAGVNGENMLQLSQQQGWEVEQMLAIYEILNVDVLVIEGFKQLDYNKIVLIRNEEDLHLLSQLTNIQAVMTALQLPQTSHLYPMFKREEMTAFYGWFDSFLQMEKGDSLFS